MPSLSVKLVAVAMGGTLCPQLVGGCSSAAWVFALKRKFLRLPANGIALRTSTIHLDRLSHGESSVFLRGREFAIVSQVQ